MPTRSITTVELEAQLGAIRHLRSLLRRVARAFAVGEETEQRWLTACSEAASNAIRHGRPNPRRLRVSVTADGEHWCIVVEDDGGSWGGAGTALADAHLPEDPLATGGRGLSLITSCCDEADYRAGPRWNALHMHWRIPGTRAGRRVLVVEDDATLRMLYSTWLSTEYTVEAVGTVAQALDRVRRRPPDAVVSDIHLPGEDGLGFRETLLESDDKKLIPFVFISGSEDPEIRERALLAGVDDYLRKPVTADQLRDSLRRVLHRHHVLREQLATELESSIAGGLRPSLPAGGAVGAAWDLGLAWRAAWRGGADLLLHRAVDAGILVLLIDVMGHDIAARFHAHAVAGYLRGLMQHVPPASGPAQLLNMLSTACWSDQIHSSSTLTATSCLLREDGHIDFATAGHPPPLHIRADGHVTALPPEQPGPMPGLLPDSGYEATRIALRDGDRLALITDGLTESADTPVRRSRLEAAVREALGRRAGLAAQPAAAQVMALFDALAGTPPPDDAMLFVAGPASGTPPERPDHHSPEQWT